jgi:rhodanese-related sulfurtransferase
VDQVARLYLEHRDELGPWNAEELRRRMTNDELMILDGRPEDEHGAGHIPGAISIPARELERRMANLPRDREVLAYCRGPYCVYAADAVESLRRTGFRARRMEQGLPDRKARGLPVETGASA